LGRHRRAERRGVPYGSAIAGPEISRIGDLVPHAGIAGLLEALPRLRFVLDAAINVAEGEATCRHPGAACLVEIRRGLRRIGRDTASRKVAFGQTAAAAPPLVRARLAEKRDCCGRVLRNPLA